MKIILGNNQKLFFTSDTHFGHLVDIYIKRIYEMSNMYPSTVRERKEGM